MPRAAFALCALVFLAPVPLLAQTPDLVRVERVSRQDLLQLRGAGQPVVFESTGSLLLRGPGVDLDALAAQGRQVEILSEGAGREYWVLGLLPGAEEERLSGLGEVLYREENWLLLATAPGFGREGFHDERVMVARLPRRPIELPAAASTESFGVDGVTPDPLVQQIVARVDTAQIDATWSDLTSNPPSGTRFSRSQGCRDAATYCFDRYAALGLTPAYDDWDPQHAPNVVAEMTGAVHPDRVYIVTGHLDDLPSTGIAPGANDNGSGSVNVLETARVMNCGAYRNTVRFLNVTGEEQGLLGSDAYAEAAWQRGEDIRAVLNMDMIAWEGNGTPDPEDLDLAYNSFSGWLGDLFAQNAATYSTGLVVDSFFCPSLTASDHASFWQRGYPAVVGITDAQGYCGHAGTYPDYHESTDTIANNGDLSLFYATVRTSVATLAELAEPFRVTFDRDSYACDSVLRVIVGDADLNTDPAARETLTLTVTSTTEPTGEPVVLEERDADSAIFEGTIALTTASPAPGDGLLSVQEADALQAQYIDASDCDGSPDVPYVASASVDCTAPVISGVTEQDVSGDAATIVWNTGEASDSEVTWGPALPPQNLDADAAEVTAHQVGLSGLEQCTIYYYQVASTDPAGNRAVADNGGTYFHFETLGDFGDGLQPCHEGRVSLDAATWSCHDSVAVTLVDKDLDLDPGAVDRATVRLTSSSETDPETLELTETDIASARFTGTISTGTGAPAPDGVLQTADGDTITVTYDDQDDGSGHSALAWDTSVIDCTGPVISELRVEQITDARALVRFATDEPADATVEWGTDPGLGQSVTEPALVTDHTVLLNQLDACQPVYIRVHSADGYGQSSTADLGGQPHGFSAGTIPGLYWKEDFEGDTSGWTLQGEWQVGAPAGLGGSSGGADPSAAYNHQRVLGHDLAGQGAYPGDYEPSTNETARSPSLDATVWRDTRLLLHKQLNTGASDDASLWLWSPSGRPLYSNEGQAVLDTAFEPLSFDIGPLADGRPSVQLEFRQQADAAGQYSGWNVDEVIFKDGTLPDFAACGGCAAGPSFSGPTRATDDDACAAGGVTVAWERAVSWGSGNGGSYAVYRDTAPGFLPGPATLLAAGVGALSYHDTSAPPDTQVYYRVLAENDEGCGGGPANGGVLDANDVELSAADTTSQPPPGAISTLGVAVSERVHLRLSWPAASGAAEYRVLRSLTPDPADFGELATTPAQRYDDIGAAADRQSYFYLVRAANACGVETP